MKNMKIGVLSFHGWNQQHFNMQGKRVANIGDSIREVVMWQILSECGLKSDDIVMVSQEELMRYSGEEIRLIFDDMINDNCVIDCIMENSLIHPVFVSCFFYDDIFVGRPDRVEYFKKYAPIGCRDQHSRDLCIRNGIEAYLVGCFTICIKPQEELCGEKVYLVDIDKDVIGQFPESIIQNAISKTHAVELEKYPITPDESKRLFQLAIDYLEEYKNHAKLVISGRLHAAIPCFAMGIPVIIINQNYNFKFGWVDKWLKFYDTENKGEIDFFPCIDSEKKKEVDKVRNLIKENIAYAVKTGRNNLNFLKDIDRIYMGREKTELNLYFKSILLKDLSSYKRDEEFSYAIWGAGLNGGYVYQIMRELFPYSTLKVIIDKYKTGTKYGAPIVSMYELKKFDIQHIIVSSSPAISEAVRYIRTLPKLKEHYSILVTKQTC